MYIWARDNFKLCFKTFWFGQIWAEYFFCYNGADPIWQNTSAAASKNVKNKYDLSLPLYDYLWRQV